MALYKQYIFPRIVTGLDPAAIAGSRVRGRVCRSRPGGAARGYRADFPTGRKAHAPGNKYNAPGADIYATRGLPSRSKALDLGSSLEGVQGFESLPPHGYIKWEAGPSGAQTYTELTSTGLEMLYHDPVTLVTKDPEYFRWICSVIKGVAL